ncbi:tRNA pseudouridine(38-40) synthase TruA [Candidatus Shikimatogenerans bostrichidophilus]|uniref:tRNA pseudouridine(38-40) synthase TruA n=1 Tax=Candidatus Shikimatogenerans bostrichidophilus TaxID=2943807 RepID=UPI00296616B6
MRYFIKLSYNGFHFKGWQKQKNNKLTIEEEIENKISIILNKPINLIGASRTDSGVHAKLMFAHFDYNNTINKKKFLYKINLLISSYIIIYDLFKVKNNVHARFSAIYRIYKYIIGYKKNPFYKNLYWYWKYKNKLNINLMNKAINIIINRKNFILFSTTNKKLKNYNCNIYYAYWNKKNKYIYFIIKSNRFLRKMVRFIISLCIEIGLNKITIYDLKNKIKKKKIFFNINIPPYGLYLKKIKYNKNIFL